jgi:hypothetical protein
MPGSNVLITRHEPDSVLDELAAFKLLAPLDEPGLALQIAIVQVGGQRLAPLTRGEDLPDPRQKVPSVMAQIPGLIGVK